MRASWLRRAPWRRRLRARRRLAGLALVLALAAGLAVGLTLAFTGGGDNDGLPDGAKRTAILTDDGLSLAADVWPGDKALRNEWVLLGHQFPDARRPWDPLATLIQDAGYTVLAWDFRCHGESVGPTACNADSRSDAVQNIWRDWNAAIDYALAQGATRIVAIGASMGGTSAVQVAAARTEIVAISAISSPNRFKGLDALENYAAVTIPKLFIVGEQNVAAPDFSRRFHAEAVGPSRLVVLDTDLHGNPLTISMAFGPFIQELLLAFVQDPGGTVLTDGPEGGAVLQDDVRNLPAAAASAR